MQILIFQSAHKRNLYISQKIFGPSHKRYPPCPSHWWIFLQTISQEIFPLPISQEISQEIFLSQEILPQIITKEIFPLTISQKIFHLRIYNSAHLTRDTLRPSSPPSLSRVGVDLGTNLGSQVFEALGQGLLQHGVERERELLKPCT